MGAKKLRSYVVYVLFDAQERKDFFKSPIGGKIGVFQKLLFRISRITFTQLISKGKSRDYIRILVGLALISFFIALSSHFFGGSSQTIINYAYIFILLLIFPFLIYLVDLHQAMQLRFAMNRAVSDKSYPKMKQKEGWEPNRGKFEWVPSNLAILNAILQKKKNLSYTDFGKIAGIDRQTAVSAINKMRMSNLIYDSKNGYKISKLRFEVWIKKNKMSKRYFISSEEAERLNHLFEVMCFASF